MQFIDQLLDDQIINSIIAPDGYSAAHREIQPYQLFRTKKLRGDMVLAVPTSGRLGDVLYSTSFSDRPQQDTATTCVAVSCWGHIAKF